MTETPLAPLTAPVRAALHEQLAMPFLEVDYDGARWIMFRMLTVRRGPASARRPRAGDLIASMPPADILKMCFETARPNAPISKPARAGVDVIIGARRLDPHFVNAVEQAYPGATWRLGAKVNFGEPNAADRFAFAYVGRDVVAMVAPLRLAS